MAMDRSRYPSDWEEISYHIRFVRAGGKCEWCGVPNGEVGARDKQGNWYDEHSIHCMNSDVGYSCFGEFPKMVKIILTVAHLGIPHLDGRPGNKHDKMDVRSDNLAALCQKCHLNYDREDHIAKAKETRRRKRDQLSLFPC